MKTKNRFNKQELDEADGGIMRTVLAVSPELELCAVALKRRCQCTKKSPYPLKDHKALFDLFEGEATDLGHHRLTRRNIERYVHRDLFPIEDDDAFVRVVYLALCACNSEMQWALQAPPYADELLAEVQQQIDKQLDRKEA